MDLLEIAILVQNSKFLLNFRGLKVIVESNVIKMIYRFLTDFCSSMLVANLRRVLVRKGVKIFKKRLDNGKLYNLSTPKVIFLINSTQKVISLANSKSYIFCQPNEWINF